MGERQIQESGFVLLIVLLLIVLTVGLAVHFNAMLRDDLLVAKNFQQSLRQSWQAKAGFNAALAFLDADYRHNSYDALWEDWAQIGELYQPHFSPSIDDGVVLSVVDHSGLIQVNALVLEEQNQDQGAGVSYDGMQLEVFMRFLGDKVFGLEQEEVQEIAANIIDWIDNDGEAKTTIIGLQSGAEALYYEGLEKPYACRNRPISHLEDLLRVKGVTRELFYGEEERPGIREFLTVTVGSGSRRGKININTAPKLVLKALGENIGDEAATDLDEYRRDENNDLAAPTWYSSVRGDLVVNDSLLTTAGEFFEIISTGRFGHRKSVVKGLVQRQAGAGGKALLQVLAKKVE